MPAKDAKSCQVPECDRVAEIKGMCRLHRTRELRGIPLDRPNRHTDAPERRIGRHGYVLVFDRPLGVKGRRRVLEHRKVMEEYIGRKLFPHEQIHHLDHDRQNNAIENLEIWSTNQPTGARLTDKLKWVEKTIEQYSQYTGFIKRVMAIIRKKRSDLI